MNIREVLLSSDPAHFLRELWKSNQKIFHQNFPELAALSMPIPQGYHHKDNLEHSFCVLENAISYEKEGIDLILRTSALFHDIGKPQTRGFLTDSKVTFYGHEVVGAKMIKKILKNSGYSESELNQISLLISLHMRAYGFSEAWTEKGARRLERDAGGAESLKRLIILFKSDLTTKHDDKKLRILDKIDQLEKFITQVKREDEIKTVRPALSGNDVMSLTGLKEGREVGRVMKYLNSPEGLTLNKEDAIAQMWRIIKSN